MNEEYLERALDAVRAMADSMGGYAMPMSEWPEDGKFTIFGRQEEWKCLHVTITIEDIIDGDKAQSEDP